MFHLFSFRYAEFLRLSRAALDCQKQYRMVRERRAYLTVRRATVTIQAYARGMFTRRIYWEVGSNTAAISSVSSVARRRSLFIHRHASVSPHINEFRQR